MAVPEGSHSCQMEDHVMRQEAWNSYPEEGHETRPGESCSYLVEGHAMPLGGLHCTLEAGLDSLVEEAAEQPHS